MNIPKFKPTKWSLCQCIECKRLYTTKPFYCVKNNHTFITQNNEPFFVPDLKIDQMGHKNWWWVGFEDKKYGISPSEFERIVLGCGIEKEGHIKDQWWMMTKKGQKLSLKWLPNDK